MQVALIRALCVAALLPLLGGQAFAVSAYVTNEKGNSITILDVDRMEAIKTFPVGKRPRGIALSPDGARLYVCTSDDDVIQVYDTASLALLGRIATSDPEQIVLSPDGARIYVANEDDNLISIFDAQTRKSIAEVPVGVEPEGVAVSPDGKTIVATSETTNMAHFIDAAARKIVGNVLVGARPRFAQFKPDGSELWVSSEVGGAVAVIDPVQKKLIAKVGFEIPGLTKEQAQPVGIRMTADGKTAFIALGPANRVAVVDTATRKVERYLLVGQRVWQLALTPGDKYLLAVNGLTNDVSIIDVTARKVLKSVQVGALPWGVAVAPK
ncbi:MAG: PQQ-dependent catabolism-associated beta-propeller protein [Rhodoblastus sp.]|nr:PQQ-dependent catabolism-associated beta-propeller protein [Rhodoblastus sp.]MCB1523034.1 PQQ-dependent catabolism-associated beta-propeller protein [Rhodoblastus sp.]